jgi:hypothetical protein
MRGFAGARPVQSAWRRGVLMVTTRAASARGPAGGARGAAAASAARPAAQQAPSAIPFDDVHNLRDLSEVDAAILPGARGPARRLQAAGSRPAPAARSRRRPHAAAAAPAALTLRRAAPPPGRVFRAAAPVYASDADIKRIYNDLGVRELIDLRSSDELKMLPQEVSGDGGGGVRGGVRAVGRSWRDVRLPRGGWARKVEGGVGVWRVERGGALAAAGGPALTPPPPRPPPPLPDCAALQRV